MRLRLSILGILFLYTALFLFNINKAYAQVKIDDYAAAMSKAISNRNKGEYSKAIELDLQLLRYAPRFPHRTMELACYKELGILYWDTGNLKESQTYFEKASLLAREQKDASTLFFVSNSIEIYKQYQEAKRLRLSENKNEAIDRFGMAIQLSKKIGSLDHLIKCQRQLSLVYWDIGNYAEYYSLNSDTLTLAQTIKNRREISNCLNNIGIYFIRLESYARAIDYCEQAYSIAKEAYDFQGETDSLSNLGMIYQEIGEYDKALDCLSKSLLIDENLGDPTQIASDYINRAIIFRKRGLNTNSPEDYQNALADLSSSLALAKRLREEGLEAAILNNMGSLFSDQGRYNDALENYKKAFELSDRLRDNEKKSRILNNLGIVSYKLGYFEESSRFLQQAINLATANHDGQLLWEAYFESANSFTKAANYQDALARYKVSISLIEDIRSSIKLEELKASYLGADKRIEAYQNLIDLLATLQKTEPDKSYDKEAFNYLERAKARAFLDSLEVAEVDISQGINPVLANREKELMRDISKAYGKLLAPGFSAEEKEKISGQIKSSEDQLEALKREIRMSSPAYADLRYPKVITYDEVQHELMSPGEAYFAYSVGKEKSHAFVVTRKGLKIFDLPARGILHQQVSAYRRAISDQQNRDFRLGRELFKELVSPGLEPGLKKIVFIPDDILNLLPFETLLTRAESNSWLIRDYMISYAPSLSSLRVLRQRHRNGPKPRGDLLAIGDTTYGSEGSGKGTIAGPDILYGLGTSPGISLTPLKYSGLEIQNIARLFNHKKVMILEKENATKRRLRSLSLADYRIIHFAVHSVIDDKKPARSAIVLSFNPDQAEDGLLQTRDIYNLKLNADLVTLSACQTGLGQFIRGEGIEGLSRPFFYAGSSSVLMSLWAVNDQATSQLMERFYRHLRGSESLMEALRNAKLELISSGALSHPYYWAGFIISGSADIRPFPWRRNLVILLASTVGISLLVVLVAATYKRKKL
jgi:CHAT domain-containing protein/tetratricopeptide (TPR) repeat protein